MPSSETAAAAGLLLDLFPGGLEEVSGGGWSELAVYTDEAGEASVRRRFDRVWVQPLAPGWEDAWRAFHRPVRAGGLWIGPPWEQPPPGEPTILVDPGRAFGTGAHPTTRACVELLAALPRRGSLLDAGCGSGVLSVAGARLGYGPLVAVDLDPDAVEVAVETAARNGVEVEVRLLDVFDGPLPEADVLVANVELGAVELLLARRPAPLAITSGYLAGERPDAPGWRVLDRRELEGWAADALEAV